MKKVVEKIEKFWDKLYKIKGDRIKKRSLDIILTLLIIPVCLIMLLLATHAMLCLMTYNFNIKFFLELIAASIMLYAIAKMVKVIIFLNKWEE